MFIVEDKVIQVTVTPVTYEICSERENIGPKKPEIKKFEKNSKGKMFSY